MTHLFAVDQTVLFTARGSHITGGEGLYHGTINSIDETKEVLLIHYMRGMKDDWADTPFADVVAIADEKLLAPYLEIEHFRGHFIDLRKNPD